MKIECGVECKERHRGCDRLGEYEGIASKSLTLTVEKRYVLSPLLFKSP